jgi:hypothetical protein
LARARRYIQAGNWTFSKSMPQWPHWYVLREWGKARDFDFVKRLIEKCGYTDVWTKGKPPGSYLVIGNFKYWVLGHVLNRAAPISNAEFRRRGLRWLSRHGKVLGPYGRAIDATKPRAVKQRKRAR